MEAFGCTGRGRPGERQLSRRPLYTTSGSGFTVFFNTLIVLFSVTLLQPSHCIEWLALANDRRQLTWNSTNDCARTKSAGLNRDQRLICKRNIDLMAAVVQASRDTVDVCQELFSDRRWNCSTVLLAPKYLPDLAGNSREQAFVQSLSSAALVQTVAKVCSAGLSAKCGCGPEPTEAPPGGGNFKWGGCADDVRYGTVFSKWFSDPSPRKQHRKMSRRLLFNSHNNAVGRKVIADSLSTQCKCHGVSGSCTVKTCFRALPLDLRPEVGVTLRNRYSVAVHLDAQRAAADAKKAARQLQQQQQQQRTRKRGGGGKASTPAPEQGSQADAPGSPSRGGSNVATISADEHYEVLLKTVKDDDLVYNTISPDYCLPDMALGSVGTKDRVCDKDSSGTGGCRSMCCGRGHTTETVEVRHRCDCKYYWCCYVKCKTCLKTVQIHRCR